MGTKMKIRYDKLLGQNIKKARNACNMTQEQVVLQLQLNGIDMSRSIYSQIEAGTYNIRVPELIALKNIFKLDSFDYFFTP